MSYISQLCPQYVSSFLDVMVVGDLTPLWTWTSWSGPVLVISIISAARLYEATSRAEHVQDQLAQAWWTRKRSPHGPH
ncbi:hypothetical protein MRX96_031756 [Rhipicephalus microplus]